LTDVTERKFQVIGGMFGATCETRVARTTEAVRAAFRAASEDGRTFSLAGGQRSFGVQYLPAAGGVVLDVGELERGAEELERASDGSVWIRAGGGTRFSDLKRLFPKHRTYCPPTTDTITLAGALAACTHSSGGYFADSVRTFRLECPNGATYVCHRDAPGLPGELFRHAVGAFGALGVVTDIELRLTPIAPDQQIAVNAVYAGPSDTSACFDALERVADGPRFAEGNGLAIYGIRGHAIVFGDELLPADARRSGPRALLTGEDLTAQIWSQAFAYRFPKFAEWMVTRTYRQGASLLAPWYGFQFFQRSYDAVHRVMATRSALAGALRLFGVPDGLPVCHTAWFFPAENLRAFVRGYFEILKRHPALVERIEQQDIVLLGPCAWPCHSMGETAGKIGVFSASFSIRRGERSQLEAEEFARAVTREAREFSPGTRASLCKQLHAEPGLLRDMHREYVARLDHYRAIVDPKRVLSSRFLIDLGVR
jgi:FAD/FMN-containing dehydrogenase